MPRISAPTVKEHRQVVLTALVDSAERLLRDEGPAALTAGAVSADAGIARNSIYRYVDSVEDLRGLVVNRYLPDWLGAVAEAMQHVDRPENRVVTWVRANLEQAAGTGHGWLMEAARHQAPNASIDETVNQAHAGMRSSLSDAWSELVASHPERLPIAVGFTVGILDAGFRQLDQGRPAELVADLGSTAARALVHSLRSEPDRPLATRD